MRKLAVWFVTLSVALALAHASAHAGKRTTVKLKAKNTSTAMVLGSFFSGGFTLLFAFKRATVQASTVPTEQHTVPVATSSGERYFLTPQQDRKIARVRDRGSHFKLRRLGRVPSTPSQATQATPAPASASAPAPARADVATPRRAQPQPVFVRTPRFDQRIGRP